MAGITLQLYDHGEALGRKGSCCAGQDIQDARCVADTLKIPHYVLDYEARFAKAVMGAFADSYLQGETPVPCVACNQKIKFHDLLETAEGLGASALATGHYVMSKPGSAGWQLHRAADKDRDQSYFLFATTPEQLNFLRFPLGDRDKDATRKLARHFGLTVAEKSDSQDICFVPTGRYTQVIERLRPGAVEAGNIVHIDGRVLGRHGGIIKYTIGQRRGLGVPSEQPLYVLKLDAARREVMVGPKECLRTRRIALRDVNWLGDEPLASFAQSGDEVLARIRSSGLCSRRGCARGRRDDRRSAYGEDGVSPGQAWSSIAQATVGSGFSAADGSSPRRRAWLAKDGFRAAASRSPGEALAAGSR